MGLVLSDLTDEQRKELDLKIGGVLIEDVVGVVRGNVQPGDVILAIIQKGAPTEAKSAAQVNDILAKLDKGASVTLQVRRGDNSFYTTLKLGNGGVAIVDAASCAVAAGDCAELTLLVRAYCHLCDEMRAALQPLADAARRAIIGNRRRRRRRARGALRRPRARCCCMARSTASSFVITGSTRRASRTHCAMQRSSRVDA